MITAWIVVSFVAGVATLLDQLRRPASAWAAADRKRSWWVTMTIFLGLAACGLFIAAAYLVGVVPQFGRASDTDESFRRAR